MRYILHRCNDAARLQQGMDDPAIDGIEVDFYFKDGHVRIGHDSSDVGHIDSMPVQSLERYWRDTSKILVVDIKNAGAFRHWTSDEGIAILKIVHVNLPLQVPVFVTGITHDWIPLVRQTIDTWQGRQVTYFVDAYSLHLCKKKFHQPGIRFGLNLGYPVSLAKKLLTDVVPSILEKNDRTANLGRGIKNAFRPLTDFELDAWNHADVKMAWTITSDEILQEILKLDPDYIIVEELPENEHLGQ